MARAPTIRQIAQTLGMSPSTVSQALNNKGSLRPETRERVIAKAKEMGYYSPSDPFGVDRVLSGRPIWFWPSGLHELPSGFELAGFPQQVWQGAQDVFEPYRIVLQLVGEKELRAGVPGDVAGTIVTGGNVNQEMSEMLCASDRPTVIVGAHEGGETGICCVECDLAEGIRLAVQHLHELGHRHIGFVNGPLTWRTSNQKLTGFVRSAFDFNLPHHYITRVADPWNTADVTALLKSLLASEWKQVTAIVGAYESIGIAALRAAKALGMDVPADLSVVTCHDEGTACSSEPPLATVALPVVRMGKLAALLVVSATRNNDVIGTRFVVQPALVVRESTAPPNRRTEGVLHAFRD